MKIIKLIICVLVCTLLIGCSAPGSDNNPDEENDDFPNDFGFVLKYGTGAKNIINTFDGTFEKDLITAGTAKTKLNFSDEELKRIYSIMKSINILDYPSDYKPPYTDNPDPGVERFVQPYETYNFYYRVNSESKDINWKDTNGSDASKAKELRNLFRYIEEIITSKKEYNRLPDAVGGYD